MATTYNREMGAKMDANSLHVDIDSHSRVHTFRMSGLHKDGATPIATITKGMVIAQRILDVATDLSGYAYPSDAEDPQWVGIATQSLPQMGTGLAADMRGRLLAVMTHGYANHVLANGAITIGDRVMPSGVNGTFLADGAGTWGSVCKFPQLYEEDHIVTAAEAAANNINLLLPAESLIGVYDTTSGAGHKYKAIYPPSGVLIADTCKLHAAGNPQRVIDGFAGDFVQNDHVFVQYMPDRRLIIGTCELTAVDNGYAQVLLDGKGV